MSELVERVARAVCKAFAMDYHGLCEIDANFEADKEWENWIPEAKAAIAAMQGDAAQGWMPIETAPKDGTAFQAIIPGHGADNVICWTDGLLDSHGEDCGSWTFASEQEPPECWTDGFCWSVNEDGVPSVKPTHWMPLPVAPVDNRVSTSSPVTDRAAPKTSDKLRDAVEVWQMASDAATLGSVKYKPTANQAAAAIIEQDREAVRAEQAAEVADYLKEGETIAECIARNRADANVLLEMFAAERVKVENYAKTMKIISDIANREAAELAKWKALAETLAWALEAIHSEAQREEGSWLHLKRCIAAQAAETLRRYKEARDD